MYKTFDELGFKEGDKVRCVHDHLETYGEGRTYILSKHDRTDSLVICGQWNGYDGDWELVEPDTDMANNRVPFGLLTEEEKEALRNWDGEIVFWSGSHGWLPVDVQHWQPFVAYRTVPKPKAIPVSDLKGTVEMKDGKPDWSTYSED